MAIRLETVCFPGFFRLATKWFWWFISAFIYLFLTLETLSAQSIPVGSVFDEYIRRKQLNGELDSTFSFTVRPFNLRTFKAEQFSDSDSLLNFGKSIFESSVGNSSIIVLPFSWQQLYKGNPTFSRNDGAIIQSKGYQSFISAGIAAKFGPLSIQMQPEYVFAVNRKYRDNSPHIGAIDLPLHFGEGTYSKLLLGQSSIRLNFDPISIGVSNENLWWGPGIQNSILMSNSAPGFSHLTFNTTRPIKTPIGSVETQIVAGRLESSGFTGGLPDDWRYFSGVVFSYQPRILPGMFLGFTRSFQTYRMDMDNTVGDYLPFFQAFQKINTNEDDKRRDQLTSVFARWLLTKSKAEVYFEYGLNDHSYNTRDFLMSPEHSRAFTIGYNKLIPFKGRTDEFIQVGLEATLLDQSLDRILRDSGEWYVHHQVIHGYTNRGQVMGAGIGPGGNLQSMNLSWVKGLKRIGIQFERYKHNAYFSYVYDYQPWIDFGAAAVGMWDHKRFIFNAKLQAIQSFNYQWLSGPIGLSNNPLYLNGELGLMYRF